MNTTPRRRRAPTTLLLGASFLIFAPLTACASRLDEAALRQRIETLENLAQVAAAPVVPVVHAQPFATVWAGGPFGDVQQLRCPPGHVAVGIDTRAGNLVVGMAMVCSPAGELLNVAANPHIPEPLPLEYARTDQAQREQMGSMGVSSSPPGMVVLDGELTTIQTPARRIQTTPGVHIVEIEWDDGRRSEARSVEIRDGVHTNIFFREPPLSDATPP